MRCGRGNYVGQGRAAKEGAGGRVQNVGERREEGEDPKGGWKGVTMCGRGEAAKERAGGGSNISIRRSGMLLRSKSPGCAARPYLPPCPQIIHGAEQPLAYLNYALIADPL